MKKDNEEIIIKDFSKEGIVNTVYSESELEERYEILGYQKMGNEPLISKRLQEKESKTDGIEVCPCCTPYYFDENQNKKIIYSLRSKGSINRRHIAKDMLDKFKEEFCICPLCEPKIKIVEHNYGDAYFDEENKQYKKCCIDCGQTVVISRKDYIGEQLGVAKENLKQIRNLYPSLMNAYIQTLEITETNDVTEQDNGFIL